MTEKKNEEWIEKILICPDCVKGRIQHWKERKSGKPAWRYHMPCTTCNGQFETIVHQPKFCQIDDCSLPSEHKCTGYFCKGEGWVCETHWKEENIGFTDNEKLLLEIMKNATTYLRTKCVNVYECEIPLLRIRMVRIFNAQKYKKV